jgi:3,4-dihydroxy-2-butanone 4-phosphate synthase
MYALKGCITQENAKKIKMLALFKTLTEEDKDFVISVSDSLARKHGILAKEKTLSCEAVREPALESGC